MQPTNLTNDAELGFKQVKRLVQGGAKRVTLLHVQDKALGHPVRLALGACCGCELLELSEVRRVSGPTVSQHLLVLKSAGVIGDERRWQGGFYHLLMPCVAGI